MLQNAPHHFGQHGHHIAVIPDEAHLQVEADVLVDMADGIVRLGAEDRADLEDPLEDAHHDLLVELWALRQVRLPVEVLHREDIRAAFGRRGDKLGRLNLGETQLAQRRPEPGHDAGRETEERTFLRVAQTDDRVIQEGGQRRSDRGLVEAQRQGVMHRRQDLEGRAVDLDPARRLRLGDDLAGDSQHSFRQQSIQAGERLRRVDHDLRQALAHRAAPGS